jgi:hypothetical protein
LLAYAGGLFFTLAVGFSLIVQLSNPKCASFLKNVDRFGFDNGGDHHDGGFLCFGKSLEYLTKMMYFAVG